MDFFLKMYNFRDAREKIFTIKVSVMKKMLLFVIGSYCLSSFLFANEVNKENERQNFSFSDTGKNFLLATAVSALKEKSSLLNASSSPLSVNNNLSFDELPSYGSNDSSEEPRSVRASSSASDSGWFFGEVESPSLRRSISGGHIPGFTSKNSMHDSFEDFTKFSDTASVQGMNGRCLTDPKLEERCLTSPLK